MLVIPSGRAMSVKELQSLNAKGPMAVTGLLSIVSGTTTVVTEVLQSVMVTVSPLI